MTQYSRKCRVSVYLSAGAIALLTTSVLAAGYSQRPEVKTFASEVSKRHGLDAQQVTHLLAQAERQDKILEAIARPAEKVLTWKDYRPIFMTDKRIQGGREFMATYREALDRAQAEYGVPEEMITAIIGVETQYGRFKGNYRVLDALATLAFDYPPRSPFFRSELEQYLLMTREQGFDPLSLKGSYAGAMGYGQFISSSYRRFAVDFDGDGKANILDNPVDAIGSVANYFKGKGWQTGDPIAVPVQVQGNGYQKLLQKDLEPQHRVAEFAAAGVTLPATLDPDAKALLLELEGANGKEYWLGLNNFYVITRYNISHLYAMAAYQLSQEIRHE